MSNEIKSSEITPESTYLNRRNFIRAGLLAGTSVATGLAYRFFNQLPPKEVVTTDIQNVVQTNDFKIEDKLNSFEDITNYNNYYEFSTSKTAVARAAHDFITRPWSIEVGGLVQKPKVFDIDELLKFEQQERIYRFRCVEGWSMVIPWIGFPIKKILDAILATGLYGKQMPNQNGAPIRLVVPWKYGFKSIKSIVKITLTDKEPPTTWNIAAPDEYGFYSNVNPTVDHPRWSQATERRIGELGRRDTLMFNGYADDVARLYEGMDLKKNF